MRRFQFRMLSLISFVVVIALLCYLNVSQEPHPLNSSLKVTYYGWPVRVAYQVSDGDRNRDEPLRDYQGHDGYASLFFLLDAAVNLAIAFGVAALVESRLRSKMQKDKDPMPV
ncbi:MAG: hypothetical protein L6R28_08975 [Planctomycetes bacterium]|nr:hypothetical protein [Planctomycetota bacterium]